MPTDKDEATQIAQAWQGHRRLCVELALKCGASSDEVLDVAKRISEYIITKSDLEKKIAP